MRDNVHSNGTRAAAEVLFTNARIFDGTSATLSEATNILVRGNTIAEIGTAAASASAIIVEGRGRTLMPGLIDAHTHIMYATVPQALLLTADIG
jgi:imidazolonepropionase-like amidohydrolase